MIIYHLGQEVNLEIYALCKPDLFLKSQEGWDAESIKFGSTLSNDQLADNRFDQTFTNPP
jgi:type I restriction enzyme M protein